MHEVPEVRARGRPGRVRAGCSGEGSCQQGSGGGGHEAPLSSTASRPYIFLPALHSGCTFGQRVSTTRSSCSTGATRRTRTSTAQTARWRTTRAYTVAFKGARGVDGSARARAIPPPHAGATAPPSLLSQLHYARDAVPSGRASSHQQCGCAVATGTEGVGCGAAGCAGCRVTAWARTPCPACSVGEARTRRRARAGVW